MLLYKHTDVQLFFFLQYLMGHAVLYHNNTVVFCLASLLFCSFSSLFYRRTYLDCCSI